MKPTSMSLLSEPLRGILDILSLAASYSYISKISPAGDKVVITVPGFTANDSSMYILRKYLKNLGHTCYGWEQGVNSTINETTIESLSSQIIKVSKKHNAKVQLIGHSLGGVCSREAAKKCSDHVESVVTLGSPFNDPLDNVSDIIKDLYQAINCDDEDQELINSLKTPPECKVASIYSLYDGIVSHHSCKQEGDYNNCKNISVSCSHMGMAHNPLVLYTIAKFLNEA